jgi:hypothetical protein
MMHSFSRLPMKAAAKPLLWAISAAYTNVNSYRTSP